MIYDKILQGRYVRLRAAEEADAEETLRMRLNADKTRFLHKVADDVAKQQAWIRAQREREGDYFFVVEDTAGKTLIGMMGIYEIEGDRGHIGRLLMNGNAMQSFEAYLLLFRFGFDTLGMKELYGDTDINNRSAYRFSQRFGFQYDEPVYDPELDRQVCYGRVYAEAFPEYAGKLDRMLYGKDGSGKQEL